MTNHTQPLTKTPNTPQKSALFPDPIESAETRLILARHAAEDADYLDAVESLGWARSHAEHAFRDAVVAAIRNGHTWTEVAARTGVTRQSLWQKYAAWTKVR